MWSLNRRGPSGFSSSSTAEEVTEGIDGTGLTAIVTGGSTGIGAETIRVLALRGVHVVMGVRNLSTGHKVKEEIIKEAQNARIDVLELDLSSMASVKNFASEFVSLNLPLNILINNAGVLGVPFSLSHDGIELHFATNHIGTKLTWLMEEGVNITANSLHPAGAIYTDLYCHKSVVNAIMRTFVKVMLKTIPQGAATTCYVALHPQINGVTGKYFSDSNVAKPSFEASDADFAKKLWDFSMDIISPWI
ncbi:hypothetical protein Cni_G19304 [Canna indica]|uniref:Short-chain dehydrogenase TIC 32, chloroplastic n=1 Tax=Canna indica TaxID=4628 RepID=A0AAQ3QIE2_9LILI|nr:hypothetical protein Cni_G19304 [Canna indica]